MKHAVLFVCMGNICRSPTAEAVFRHKLAQHALATQVGHDSAGTHAYHVGEAPDGRSQTHATRRGYRMNDLRARQVHAEDFAAFDLILAMDKQNLRLLQQQCPPGLRHKISLFLDFADGLQGQEVPDPYYGGADGFETVLDLCEAAADGLLAHLAGD